MKMIKVVGESTEAFDNKTTNFQCGNCDKIKPLTEATVICDELDNFPKTSTIIMVSLICKDCIAELKEIWNR